MSRAQLLKRSAKAAIAGATIVEAVVAAGVIVVGFSGLFPLGVRTLKILRTQTEMAQATQAIQERIDGLRAQDWGVLTNGVSYTTYTYTVTDPADGSSSTETWTRIINSIPASAASLDTPSETVTISSYGSTGTPPAPFTITNNNGAISVSSSTADLSAEKMVRIDTKLQWKEGGSQRTRSQETSFIVSQEGVGK